MKKLVPALTTNPAPRPPAPSMPARETAPISRRTALAWGATAATGVLLAPELLAAASQRKVVVWSEGTANVEEASKKVYPQDVNTAIAEGLQPLAAKGWQVLKANINQPDQGLSDELLDGTAVLIWWGHMRHDDVSNELVNKINDRVRRGQMGFIGTHSCHFAKPFKKLMGTACSWREYVEDGTSAEIIVKDPNHPICKGVKSFKLPAIERYGEPFAVPTPDSVPLDGIYTKPDGTTEPGRMGLCWTVGKGRVFYFTPGHETHNDYYRPEVRQIFVNAVQWAAPQ